MNLEKITELWMKLLASLDKISWKSIAKAVVIILISMACFTLYEHRVPFYKRFLSVARVSAGGMLPSPPSDATQEAVKKLVVRDSIIGAAQLVNADLARNQRVVIYTHADDWNIKYWLEEFYKRRLTPTPLFLDGDEAGVLDNNTRMISIINGQVDCQPFEKNIVSQRIPELAGKVSMLCSVSIPPYYFSGYLTLWLTRIPTPREMEDLRADARSLSSDIYDMEFQR
jgi:hypothetical protein